MKAVLALEIIGDNFYAGKGKQSKRQEERYEKILGRDKVRPWVARIIGIDEKYGFKREFLRGQRDYRDANSIGSRGVVEYFVLDSGVYEIHERITWKKTRRYFILVDGTEITEIDYSTVVEWLQKNR